MHTPSYIVWGDKRVTLFLVHTFFLLDLIYALPQQMKTLRHSLNLIWSIA